MRNDKIIIMEVNNSNYNQLRSFMKSLGFTFVGGIVYSNNINVKINLDKKTYTYLTDNLLPPIGSYCFAGSLNMLKRKIQLEIEKDDELLSKSDNVHKPNHYRHYSLETIEAIKAQCTPDEYRGVLKGNVLKYIARYRFKNGIEDLNKAQQYLTWLVEFEEEQKNVN